MTWGVLIVPATRVLARLWVLVWAELGKFSSYTVFCLSGNALRHAV